MTAISINRTLLKNVSKKAQEAARGRTNLNFHELDETVQRFLNAIEPGSYVRPHRHITPEKTEVFLCLKGKGAALLFDDAGQIIEILPLWAEKGFYGVEIRPPSYHSVVTLERGSVFYEVKPGPYDPLLDKGFAPWAPDEKSAEAASYQAFLAQQAEEALAGCIN